MRASPGFGTRAATCFRTCCATCSGRCSGIRSGTRFRTCRGRCSGTRFRTCRGRCSKTCSRKCVWTRLTRRTETLLDVWPCAGVTYRAILSYAARHLFKQALALLMCLATHGPLFQRAASIPTKSQLQRNPAQFAHAAPVGGTTPVVGLPLKLRFRCVGFIPVYSPRLRMAIHARTFATLQRWRQEGSRNRAQNIATRSSYG